MYSIIRVHKHTKAVGHMDHTFGVGIAVGPARGSRPVRFTSKIIWSFFNNRLEKQELLLLAGDQNRPAICEQRRESSCNGGIKESAAL